MKKVFLFAILLVIILFPMTSIHAKRAAPAPVAPLEYKGVIYTAPEFKEGLVEARNKETGALLWSTKVYSVKYNPELEADVQNVFITKLQIADEKLLVVNEKNQKYFVNLQTGVSVNDAYAKGYKIGSFLAIVLVVGLFVFAAYKILFK